MTNRKRILAHGLGVAIIGIYQAECEYRRLNNNEQCETADPYTEILRLQECEARIRARVAKMVSCNP